MHVHCIKFANVIRQHAIGCCRQLRLESKITHVWCERRTSRRSHARTASAGGRPSGHRYRNGARPTQRRIAMPKLHDSSPRNVHNVPTLAIRTVWLKSLPPSSLNPQGLPPSRTTVKAIPPPFALGEPPFRSGDFAWESKDICRKWDVCVVTPGLLLLYLYYMSCVMWFDAHPAFPGGHVLIFAKKVHKLSACQFRFRNSLPLHSCTVWPTKLANPYSEL